MFRGVPSRLQSVGSTKAAETSQCALGTYLPVLPRGHPRRLREQVQVPVVVKTFSTIAS